LVVIENQLEQTDHSHLGQLITYAAGLDAGVVVWISRSIRDEHRQALDWLNRGENSRIEYFGVVVELLRIGDSKPALNLKVIASPNRWSKNSLEASVQEDITGRYAAYRKFFQQLIDELREKHKFTNARVGQPQNWYTFTSGTRGFQYGASFAKGNRIWAEIYIDLWDKDQNTTALSALESDKSGLELAFGEPLSWELLDAKRACRIAIYRNGSIDDSADMLEDYHRWLIERLLKFRSVFGPVLASIATKLVAQSSQNVVQE
jgi:hypothetical protein